MSKGTQPKESAPQITETMARFSRESAKEEATEWSKILDASLVEDGIVDTQAKIDKANAIAKGQIETPELQRLTKRDKILIEDLQAGARILAQRLETKLQTGAKK